MEPLLELRRVTVAFQTADGPRPVLTDINLTLAPGEFVALVGPNGSGKSTLGRVLAGLCPVSRGEIRGALVPASAERDARSRRTSGGRRSAGSVPRAALVSQNPEAQIIGETVYEDVCFGLENLAVPPAEMHRRAMEALQRVGLADLADTSVTRLSGGQKQLLAVASNLVLDPRLIVFDESTAMLDPAARRLVLDTARNLTESGTTVVWITQWMDETAVAPRVIALHHGRIVHDGDARTFFYGGACETLGFTAPYTVRVARALADRGLYLPEQPLTPSELAAAVAAARQRTERPVHAGAGPTGGSAR